MKVQVDWLKEYTEIDVPTNQLGHVLTMAGLEIESHETVVLLDGEKSEVLELNVTPNRGYCLSHIGVAREVSALLNKTLQVPDPLKDLESALGSTPVGEFLEVEILETELCPRYCALVLENIKVEPSPKWLKDRLIAIGLRPINNIVDITNFVMMEYGQPLHAFDLELLEGGKIIVRRAKDGEKFSGLDGTEIKLESDALVIADGIKPVALAGIMGGANSQVSDTTCHIVLESAYFDSATVRKASKKYGLRSDSSYRFERGVDWEGVVSAQARAILLMKELAGGKICAGQIDVFSEAFESISVPLRLNRVNKLLGSCFNIEEVRDLLTRLGMEIGGQTEEMEVIIPSFRPDLSREVDLIEEIARVDGFDKVDTVYPIAGVRPVRVSTKQSIVKKVREVFCHAGFSETVHYSFIENVQAEKYKSAFASDLDETIALMNPLSSDYDTMRTSLLPGLLKAARANLSKGQKPLKLFEVGSVYNTDSSGVRIEKAVFSAIVLGPYELTPWKPRTEGYDFFDLKGSLEVLFEHLHLKLETSQIEKSYLLPESSVQVEANGRASGYLAQMSGSQVEDLGHSVFAFEIDLGILEDSMSASPRFQPIPKFPETFRDISILVDKSVMAQRVIDVTLKAGSPLIQKVALYDHFEGKKIQSGKKSLTFALSFQSSDKTLSDDEVNPLFEKIIETLKSGLGASLRE